jgi:SAM-dependent methyltransferase
MLLDADAYGALDATYDPGPLESAGNADALRLQLRVDEKAAFLAPLLAGLGPKAQARVLDIGCGQGGMLLAARDLGCRAKGVEPSRDHSRIARDTFGLDVVTGYFESAALLPERFDLVILSHVIEHVYRPAAFLEDVMRVVDAGGLLVVVTPNAAGMAARLCGRWWTMLKPHDHVSMMTPDGLRRTCPSAAAVAVRRSEYPWEPLVALLQGLRDRWREGSADGASPQTISAATFGARMDRLRHAMWLLTALSWPLHLFNRLAGTQACLVAEYRKRGEGAA